MKSKYNTNLAAEFWVLSMLHRLGAEATLTLGNKKAVDIVVVREAGDTITIDVKGLAGTTNWPVDNVNTAELKPNHFLAFVTFLDKISDVSSTPEVYVVPLNAVPELIYSAPGGRRVVPLRTLRRTGTEYRDAWAQLM